MTDSGLQLQPELELIRKDIVRLVLAVESMVVRMRRVERFQHTMDTIMSNTSENN